MHKFKNWVARSFEQYPVEMTVVTVALVVATTKMIQAASSSRSQHAYARQVDYRIKHGL